MADLFAKTDDPNYWDEGIDDETSQVDRRDRVGVILSYKDLKKLQGNIPDPMLKKMIKNIESWSSEVRDVL